MFFLYPMVLANYSVVLQLVLHYYMPFLVLNKSLQYRLCRLAYEQLKLSQGLGNLMSSTLEVAIEFYYRNIVELQFYNSFLLFSLPHLLLQQVVCVILHRQHVEDEQENAISCLL